MRRGLVWSLVLYCAGAVIALLATILTGNTILLGLDLKGGVSVVLQPQGTANTGQLDEAVKIIAQFMQQSPDTLSYLFTKVDYFRDPFMVPNIKSLQSSIDITVDLGLAPRGITVAPNYVDLSFVEEARKRIEASP